jgi:hypothetical protein
VSERSGLQECRSNRTNTLASFLKTFERRVVKPRPRRLKPWRHTVYGDIHVSYRDHLDGGGRTSGMDYKSAE